MNSKTISIHLTASILIIVAFESCQRSTTINQPEQSLTIVSHDLPAYEIMKMQGITSLHYVLYDSSAKGSPLDSSFYPLDEYFIDSNHVESIEYFGNNHYGYVSVFDLRKNVAWYYLNGQVTYMDSLNLPAAVEQGIQSSLGSFLKVPATYLGSEYVDDKLCYLFQDSTGYKEWIWTEHLLPIKSRGTGPVVINTTRKTVLELNVTFPDYIFEPRN